MLLMPRNFVARGKKISCIKAPATIERVYYSSVTFQPSNDFIEWKVPYGLTEVDVDCVGTQGYGTTWAGGLGGRVQCRLAVTPGQVLYLSIYAYSRYTTDPSSIPYAPAHRTARYNAADIRTSKNDLNSRIIVAGGGGCMPDRSEDAPTQAGHGGGLIGATGAFARGVCYGGTQTEGGGWTAHGHSVGVARIGGYNGTFGLGGQGGGSAYGGEGGGGWTGSVAAGAGGAGWYGGGGGQASEYYGRVWGTPGGGGSSYTHPDLCTNVVHTQGYRSGSGYITISAVNEGDYVLYEDTPTTYAVETQGE